MKALGFAIKKHEGWIAGTETRTAATGSGQADVTADAICRSALQEWEHWGRSTLNLITGVREIGKTEKSSGFAEYVYGTYYLDVVKKADPGNRQNMIDRIAERKKPHYPWSAVAISCIMKNAGITKEQFRFSQRHSTYIRAAVKAKKSGDTAAAYWGFRIDEAVPRAGDLIGHGRGNLTFEEAQELYDREGSYESHADIVVEARPGEIDVIGGNVSESVTKKTLATDPKSGILTDRSFPWFVVMKRRLPS